MCPQADSSVPDAVSSQSISGLTAAAGEPDAVNQQRWPVSARRRRSRASPTLYSGSIEYFLMHSLRGKSQPGKQIARLKTLAFGPSHHV